MTDVVVASSNLPAGYSGMDDLSPSDLAMPRLKIGSAQDAGTFIDSLSGAKTPTVDVIILGIVKQRLLWPAQMPETAEDPLCKSLNFTRGTPGEKFPWEKSGFDKADVEAGDGTIACDACPLKEWGSHPSRDNVPWCNEQIVLAVLLGPSFAPAVLTTKTSALKPTRAYLSSFLRDGLPPFGVVTTIALDINQRGQVVYSVPKFQKGEATDPDNYGEYVTTFEGMKRFLQTPPKRDDEAPAVAAPAPAAPAPAATPAQQPAPAATAAAQPASDLPF